ncbi:MAG: hypothetical protein J6P16_01875 [Eubacterium sp.]|nr:hypothetical protein [Eubacterium sp.]
MVTSKKTKIRLVVSTIVFMLVFIGIVAGFLIAFSSLKASNEEQYNGRVVATGTADELEETEQ